MPFAAKSNLTTKCCPETDVAFSSDQGKPYVNFFSYKTTFLKHLSVLKKLVLGIVTSIFKFMFLSDKKLAFH